MSQGKIVLMACGSFSPPTYMHLRMFEIARDYIHTLGLGTVVGGIISPVHDKYGKKDLVAAQHRIAMLKLALRSSAWVKVSEWEAQQPEWTRTRLSLQYHQDTINQHLSQNVSQEPPAWLPDDVLNVNSLDEPDNRAPANGGPEQVTVKLLCGADLLESFATPGLWADEDLEAIVGQHGLVVVTRAGCEPGRFLYESDSLYKLRKNVILVTNYIANEVSSTVLRRLLRRRESAKYLTDDAVLAYARAHRLYADPRPRPATEYNTLNDLLASPGKRSPQDVAMASPEETSFKNILISIRDRPSIVGEAVTVKRRKSKYLMPSMTDSVSPAAGKPRPAFDGPGRAVKVVSEEVSPAEATHSSLDSYLDGPEARRRVSEGSVGREPAPEPAPEPRKRCTSTIRKLAPEVKKSRSEVSRLCEKVKSIKLKEREPRNYKTRSCNDIVRLVLTKHGIHVISDTEAIV